MTPEPVEPPPRPGRGVLKRGAIAAVFITLLTAGAVSAVGLLQIDEVQGAFEAAQVRNGGAIKLKEITPAEAGKPQTIMILGTDERLGADKTLTEDARSDTIILARLNADQDAISLMSIPRDLKVKIPGYAIPDKINAAFSNGGANLTAKTVKRLLSRPGRPFKINHVVQVSFTGFRRMVDFLGCSFIDVDRRYYNARGGVGGYATINIKPGYQRICGKDALDYVRYRHTDNDLIRGARQQDFVRQLLRQPGVRKRLNFSNKLKLARIAGRYTRTDKALGSKKQIFTLLKLGLAVADQPVQQVPFGDGRLGDDGSYLTAPDSAIHASVDQFMHPRTEVTSRKAAKPEPTSRRKRRIRRRTARGWQNTAGMQNAKSAGETQAISVARRLDFPFYYPSLLPATGRYVNTLPRTYTIKAAGKRHDAYRAVVDLGVDSFGEFLGVQGTTWRNPPILQGPHDTIRVDKRKLQVFYDGKKVRLVAWRTKRGVYWIANSLQRTQPYSRMVATARSLTRVGAR